MGFFCLVNTLLEGFSKDGRGKLSRRPRRGCKARRGRSPRPRPRAQPRRPRRNGATCRPPAAPPGGAGEAGAGRGRAGKGGIPPAAAPALSRGSPQPRGTPAGAGAASTARPTLAALDMGCGGISVLVLGYSPSDLSQKLSSLVQKR